VRRKPKAKLYLRFRMPDGKQSPPGRRHALIASLAETGGGLLLALGLLTPLAAALLCGVMLVAAISVHIKKGFFVTGGGYEYTLVLGVAALTLAFTGPGALSLDACSDTT
jgi:putative oxidoreductase